MFLFSLAFFPVSKWKQKQSSSRLDRQMIQGSNWIRTVLDKMRSFICLIIHFYKEDIATKPQVTSVSVRTDVFYDFHLNKMAFY